MSRKLTSLFLAFVLVISSMAPAVLAQDSTDSQSHYSLNDSFDQPDVAYEPSTASAQSLSAAQLQAVTDAVYGDIAFGHVKTLSETIGSRVAGSAEEAQAAYYIKAEFEKLGMETKLQPFSYTRSEVEKQSANVIATKPGDSSEVVIVGAHYDSVSVGRGADDNASGVGVMLEAAARVASINTPYTIKFIAFGAEEEGLQGSRYYVSRMLDSDKLDTIAMINLDSLIAGDKMYVHGSDGESGWVRELALSIADRSGLDVEINPGLNPAYPAGTTGDWSDHAPFNEVGIPYLYFEATNWEIDDLDGYTQTEDHGSIWHTPNDYIGFIETEFPGRIGKHLSTYSEMLTKVLTEIKAPLRVSDRKASMTLAKEIDVELDFSATVTNAVYDVNELTWTFGGKTFDEWKQWSASNSSYSGAPFITFVEPPVIDGTTLKAKIKFDLVYTLRQGGADVPTDDLSNRSVRVRYPELIGMYDLAVAGPSGETLASTSMKLNVYDSYHTYDEIPPTIDAIIEDARPDRYVDLQVLGQSVEGRDIHFAIVAKDQASVDKYLNEIRPLMLEDPEALQEKLANGELGDYKVPVWINNIHPDEAPGVDVIIDFLRTLTQDDEVTYNDGVVGNVTFNVDEVLENVIFLLNFNQNPDGRYHNTRGNVNGFDLNRDNSYQTQIENQIVVEHIATWSPISFLDLHGFVGGFLIEPCTPPHDPNFEYDLLIDAMLEQANAMGNAGIANTSYDSYFIPFENHRDGEGSYQTGWDDFTPAYTAVYAMHHGALGHTIEIPELNQESQLALYYAGLAAADYVSSNKDRLFDNQLEFFKRGVNGEDNRNVDQYFINAEGEVIGRPRGEHDHFFPEYYVLPVDGQLQKNALEAYRMVEYLLRNGVKVDRTTQAVTVDGTVYPAGTYIVDMHQAKRGYANTVLYDGSDVSDWRAMYAEIVQNFPDLRGFDRFEVRGSRVFEGTTQPVASMEIPSTTIPGNAEQYVIRNTNNDAIIAVNELLEAGKDVEFLLSGRGGYAMGDFVVSRGDLESIAPKYYLEVTAYDGRGTSEALGNPKLYASISSDTRFVLDMLGFDTVTDANEADVIVHDSGSVDTGLITGGKPYVGFGRSAMNTIQNIVDGFAFTGTGGSHEGLFKADVDQSNLITGSYDAVEYLYTAIGAWISEVPEEAYILASVSEDEDYFKSGWWPGNERIQGQVMGVSLYNDDANITVFAIPLTHKAHTQHQFRMLANAIYTASLGIDPYQEPIDEEDDSNDGGNDGGSGGGGGSGGSGGSGSTPPTEPAEPETPEAPETPELPETPGTPEPAPVFTDIATVPWAVEAITELSSRGIILGVGNGEFAPTRQLTRAEFITMLVRAFDLVNIEASESFADVNPDDWFYMYVASAAELNLVSGVGDNRFDPTRVITRQEMAVMGANFLKFAKGLQVEDADGVLAKFADAGDIPDYAKEAVALLTQAGVVNGTSANTFTPNGLADRAQAAVIIFNILSLE